MLTAAEPSLRKEKFKQGMTFQPGQRGVGLGFVQQGAVRMPGGLPYFNRG